MCIHSKCVSYLMRINCVVKDPDTGIPNLKDRNTRKACFVAHAVFFCSTVSISVYLTSSLFNEKNAKVNLVLILKFLDGFLEEEGVREDVFIVVLSGFVIVISINISITKYYVRFIQFD